MNLRYVLVSDLIIKSLTFPDNSKSFLENANDICIL